MKFNFEKSALLKELIIAQEIIATKTAVSILSNVLLAVKDGKLTIRATDVKVNFETTIPVEVIEEGKTTVFCDKLVSVINSLPDGEIEVSEKDQSLNIRSIEKKAKFQLKTIADNDFPSFVGPADIEFFEIPAKDLKEMISNTIFAVSDDQTRYFMNGICMKKTSSGILFVATDGRRLSYIKRTLDLGGEDYEEVIIPTKILTIINKRLTENGNVSIGFNEKFIFFDFNNYKFSSPLIEGKFPNYERVIPETQEKQFEVNRVMFLDAIKRVSLLVERNLKRIYFELSNGKLSISSNEKEVGNAFEEIACTYNDEDEKFAFNYSYLEEPMKVMDSESVIMKFTDINHAMTLSPSPETDYFHIIMPMHID
ncbi:MAG: DNA polymerase III subunit beta [Treponemataceae bacterium]